MTKSSLVICNKLGLHARAAAKLASVANQYCSDCQLLTQHKAVDCKSVMALMLLAAAKGTEVQVNCQGDDEVQADSAICALINNRFDEAE